VTRASITRGVRGTRRRHRAADLVLGAAAAAQLGIAAWLTPATAGTAGDGHGALCWLVAVTGQRCPFCGMTRSFVALMHGDVAGALFWHPAGPLLAAAMAALVVAVATAALRARPPVWRGAVFRRSLEGVALASVALAALRGW
jgi:hypothetical protein